MKHFLLYILFLAHMSPVSGQNMLRASQGYDSGYTLKRRVDSSVYNCWPTVINPAISNDGKYFIYTIENQPKGQHTLILQSLLNSWKMDIIGASNSFSDNISQNSKFVVFPKTNDSLGVVNLGSSIIEYIPFVRSFKLPKRGTGEWLAYHLKNPANELVLRNMISGKNDTIAFIKDYLFSEDGKKIVLQSEVKKGDNSLSLLSIRNLANHEMVTIWSTLEPQSKPGGFIFDESGNQFAFTVEERVNNQLKKSIWRYKFGDTKADIVLNDQSVGIPIGLSVDRGRLWRFSRDGSRLFFSLRDERKPLSEPRAVGLNVWSYTDVKLQSQQLSELGPRMYLAIIQLKDNQVIRLEQEDEQLSIPDKNEDEYGIIVKREGDPSEANWNIAARPRVYIISTKNGERKILSEKRCDLNVFSYSISPEGKYVIYYDPKKKNFMSYEISTGEIRNITKTVSTNWVVYEDDIPIGFHYSYPIRYWLPKDTAMFIYDRYDVWQVDPSGKKAPLNITNGFGKMHNIVFRLLEDYQDRTSNNPKIITSNDELILSAFNRTTKNNGFYKKILSKVGDPELLAMDPYCYYINSPPVGLDGGHPPIKALNAGVYIVRRMSAVASPNYFVTRNFKTFNQLSDVHPESDYNWYTTELHNWKTLDGSLAQGVLYKPEDFDPKRKYPLIFYYYELRSDGLNLYMKPTVSDGRLDILRFVSNGYLVFSPDIHFKIGRTGESAFNSVVSAAQYLAKKQYVDSNKMGIQGISFGGFATNYIVTHTHRFAAACTAAGESDFISGYGAISYGNISRQSAYELGQDRIGATLWQNPQLYINNSPVLRADKVTTPLLLMHTTVDGAVPFTQAVELFTALRRNGKKAWLLEYTDGNHGVWGKSAADFSIRLVQFFDHYLKDAPAPKWMTVGVPAYKKGIDNGLALDYEIKTPGLNLLGEDNKKPVKMIPKMIK